MSQTVAASPETSSGRRRIPYKWSVLTNTTLGMLMATINASILIISLPAIFARPTTPPPPLTGLKTG